MSNRAGSCRIGGCDQPIHARDLCSRHYGADYRLRNRDRLERYNAARRKPGPDNRIDRTQRKTCTQCGHEFGPPPRCSHAQWERREFCGARCANVWRARQQVRLDSTLRAEAARWARWWEHERSTEDRAELERDQRRDQRRARRMERATRPLAPPRHFVAGACPDCGASVVVIRGWWNDSIRCPECTKRYWRGSHRARARRYQVAYEHINDHIVPMSEGGPHVWENVQCAHARCNFKKWATGVNDQLRLRTEGPS
jgi:hypothetical protein